MLWWCIGKKNKSVAGTIYKTKRKFQTACHLSRCEYEAPSTTQLHLPKESTWKRCLHSENTSNVYRPHYAWDKRIRKRCVHSENASWSRVLLPLYAGETSKQKFDFKESSGSSHIIILNSSFPKLLVFNWFFIIIICAQTQSRRFQIPPGWRAFRKSSTAGLTVERKLPFHFLRCWVNNVTTRWLCYSYCWHNVHTTSVSTLHNVLQIPHNSVLKDWAIYSPTRHLITTYSFVVLCRPLYISNRREGKGMKSHQRKVHQHVACFCTACKQQRLPQNPWWDRPQWWNL